MSLTDLLDKLAAFDATGHPVLSLYLNTQPDQHGRDNFDAFIRKEFRARAKTYAAGSDERISFDRDVERINEYLADKLRPQANGLVIFACAGADDFFEAAQLDAPIENHRLYVYHQPHVYPLARLIDQYPRYAALVADTNSARLFVFGRRGVVETEEVKSKKKFSRTKVGGWSQMRYQRHVENYHLQHAKEVVDALDRVVSEEAAEHVILAGDESILSILREQLPQPLADKVIDALRLEVDAPEQEVMAATLESLREHDAQSDAERVERLLDEYRAGGLAVVGASATLEALGIGQVDELLITASLSEIEADEEDVSELLVPDDPVTEAGVEAPVEESRTIKVILADELVSRARQTDARVTFIEDAALLSDVGGVGAMLRYKI